MTKQEIYKKYFSLDNMRLAWERMIRSTGRDVKDYFGIELYSSQLERNLKRLSIRIIEEGFVPSRPFKYFEPKASKTHRTKSVLRIEDALVYQAIADKIATMNYETLTENNNFVFGSVLHPEVELGTEILLKEESEYYFFEYYIPLYNKFIDSVNHEIKNDNIRFKLETDITGFFDSIPHSRLLLMLDQLGIEEEILDLLEQCLNLYSGTNDSPTFGVGIPQGPAPSFFFANLFLNDLDHEISQNGYTYYRYMDDIRIYEEKEEKLTDVLVLIDSHLKGKALSLNSKKTSIEEMGKNNDRELIPLLWGSGSHIEIIDEQEEIVPQVLLEQSSDNYQNEDYEIKTLSEDELVAFCKNEIKESETYLLNKFKDLGKPQFNARNLANDDSLKKEIIHYAYRWRSSNVILKEKEQTILHPKLIDIWLFCTEHFFWKANHFCWNLNQYGANENISIKLKALLPKFQSFEWVRYQILSNLAIAQNFKPSELKQLFRDAKIEPSALVRIGYYTILLHNVNNKHQLFTAVKHAIKTDPEPYVKNRLLSFVSRDKNINKTEVIKSWLGL